MKRPRITRPLILHRAVICVLTLCLLAVMGVSWHDQRQRREDLQRQGQDARRIAALEWWKQESLSASEDLFQRASAVPLSREFRPVATDRSALLFGTEYVRCVIYGLSQENQALRARRN